MNQLELLEKRTSFLEKQLEAFEKSYNQDRQQLAIFMAEQATILESFMKTYLRHFPGQEEMMDQVFQEVLADRQKVLQEKTANV